jgi:hypothetical protein
VPGFPVCGAVRWFSGGSSLAILAMAYHEQTYGFTAGNQLSSDYSNHK